MQKLISFLILFAVLGLNLSILSTAQEIENQYSLTRTEHLSLPKKVAKKTPTNLVMSSNALKTIIEYNVIEVTFAQNFSTKNAKVGDTVPFLLNDGLCTKEGSRILPQGTRILAVVTNVVKPKSFNRSGKVMLKFVCIELPNGQRFPLKAKVFSKKDQLSRGKLNALGKGLGTTLGVGAVGVGAGCGIGVAAGAVIVGGFAIGLPIGIAVGAIAGLVTPGLHYKAKAGDKLLIQFTDDLTVIE